MPSRGTLRLQLQEVTKERDQLLERLEATTHELRQHSRKCGLSRPGWLRQQFDKVWVWAAERA